MLKRSYDVVIVGGGVMGSSVAYHLSKMIQVSGANGGKKLSIAVIEKDKKYLTASAMLSAGGVRQQFSAAENTQMSMFGAEFLKSPELLRVDDVVPDFQFHENGYLFLASEDTAPVMRSSHQTQQSCGVSWVQLMEVDKLREKFPWLNTDNISLGSFGHKNEGYFDPWSLLTALKAKAISQGVDYIDGEVTHAKVSNAGNGQARVDCIGYQNGTDSVEEVLAGAVVNTCGPWAGKFNDLLARSAPSSTPITALPVKARKRTVFLIHCSPDPSDPFSVPPTNTPLTVDASMAWFRSEGSTPGTFLCGVSPPEDQDPDCDSEETLQRPDHHVFEDIIWPALYNRVPAFERLKVKSFWSGFYEYNTLDQNGIIGAHHDFSNLFLCNGFSGHGLQQAPAAGRAVAELLMHGHFATLDLSRLGFGRVVKNEPFFEDGVV